MRPSSEIDSPGGNEPEVAWNVAHAKSSPRPPSGGNR